MVMTAGGVAWRDLQFSLPAHALASSEAEETKVSIHMCQTLHPKGTSQFLLPAMPSADTENSA